jgi:hypothetical protein
VVMACAMPMATRRSRAAGIPDDCNATPGPVVAACCLRAARSSDPGRRESTHRAAIHVEHNRQDRNLDHANYRIVTRGAVSRNRSMRVEPPAQCPTKLAARRLASALRSSACASAGRCSPPPRHGHRSEGGVSRVSLECPDYALQRIVGGIPTLAAAPPRDWPSKQAGKRLAIGQRSGSLARADSLVFQVALHRRTFRRRSKRVAHDDQGQALDKRQRCG